jgi:hypothetical protein
MRRRRSARQEAESLARRRHPTALWVPDLDEMRRRAVARDAAPNVTAPTYQEVDEPA